MTTTLKTAVYASSPEMKAHLENHLRQLGYVNYGSIHIELADVVKQVQQSKPDIVIIDMTDRELDAGLCIQALSMDVDNPVVIFALHANLDHQVILQAVQTGAKEFIHYPQHPENLELAFKRYLAIIQRSSHAGHAALEKEEGKVFSVFSAKGGTGSSTVAVNLAYELHLASEKPVVYLDIDQWYNNTAVLLGITPDYSLGDLAENNVDKIDDQLLKRIIVQHENGLHVVVGNKNILDNNDMIPPELLEKVLVYLRANFAYVVVDLPTYVLDFYHNCLVDQADEVLLISSLDVPAMFRTCQYLELARQYYPDINKLKLVMNRWNLKAAYGMSNKNLEEQFQYPVYARLANDWEMNVESNSRGSLWSQVKPKSELVRNLQKLVELLTGNVHGSKPVVDKPSQGLLFKTDDVKPSGSLLGRIFGSRKEPPKPGPEPGSERHAGQGLGVISNSSEG